MNYDDLLLADQRLVALRVLNEDPGYRHNESILRKALSRWGHEVSRDKMRSILCWLQEQGLLTIEDVSGYMVATLTSRGSDVANGKAMVPGVERPGPRD